MARKRLLDRVRDDLQREGLAARSKKSREWLISKIKDYQLNASAKMGMINLGKLSRKPAGIQLGKMYFFGYSPKTANVLPYYDTFPLVFVMDFKPPEHSESRQDSGFLGLNLHYLPYNSRIALLNKLYDITTDDRFDNKTRVMMSYRLMKSQQVHYKEAYACIKWYLFNYFPARALEISASEWDMLAFLPYASFQKSSQSKVWIDSLKKIKQYKGK